MGDEKKEFLWSYAEKIKIVRQLERELKECRLAGVLPSKPNDGMPHGSSKGDLSGYVERIMELEDKLKAARREAVQAQADIFYSISLLEDKQEKEVLRSRYIELLQWWEVADRIGRSERHAKRIHGEALKKFILPIVSPP